jgi:hypothetical protein
MKNEHDNFTHALETAYPTPKMSESLQTRLTNAAELAEQRARKKGKPSVFGEYAPLIKVGLLATGLIGMVVGSTLWMRHLNDLPTLKYPVHTLPSPNGYDYFQKAAGHLVLGEREQKIAEGAPLAFDGKRFQIEAKPLEKEKRPPLEDRKRLLAKNTKALHLLQEGLKYDSYLPSPDLIDEKAFAEWTNLRRLGNLLGFACQVYQDEGNYKEATKLAVDLIEYGVKIPKGGGSMPHSNGASFEDLGYAILRQNLIRLSTSECKIIITHLEEVEHGREYFGDIVFNDDIKTQKQLMKFSKNGFRWEIVKFEPPTNIKNARNFTKILTMPTSTSIINTMHYYSSVLEQIQPYYAANTSSDKINTDLDPMANWAITRIDPSFAGLRYTCVQSQLLLAELGIRAYRLEKHHLPETLQDLVRSGYLKSVPIDTYGPTYNKPLSYRPLSKKTYLLYSFGPDGEDNKGAIYQGKDLRSWGFLIFRENKHLDLVSGKFPFELGEESTTVSDYRR